MKKLTLMLTLACMSCFTVCAQEVQEKKPTIAEKTSKIWNNAKSKVNNTTKAIKEQLGIDNEKKAQLRAKYMPVYTENKYKDENGNELMQLCRKMFYERYTNSYIQSVVIPTEDWSTSTVENEGNIEGYLQTLYCYILAKDGTVGYINAEFTIQRLKSPGGAYDKVSGRWPEMSRVDIIPEEDFKELAE